MNLYVKPLKQAFLDVSDLVDFAVVLITGL